MAASNVSQSAMRLARTTFSFQTLLPLDRRDLCRVFADVSGCVRRADCITGKEQRIEGRKWSCVPNKRLNVPKEMFYGECATGTS